MTNSVTEVSGCELDELVESFVLGDVSRQTPTPHTAICQRDVKLSIHADLFARPGMCQTLPPRPCT
jgi:hypothetical protein